MVGKITAARASCHTLQKREHLLSKGGWHAHHHPPDWGIKRVRANLVNARSNYTVKVTHLNHALKQFLVLSVHGEFLPTSSRIARQSNQDCHAHFFWGPAHKIKRHPQLTHELTHNHFKPEGNSSNQWHTNTPWHATQTSVTLKPTWQNKQVCCCWQQHWENPLLAVSLLFTPKLYMATVSWNFCVRVQKLPTLYR